MPESALSGLLFTEERQLLLWCAFFASFAVKVPMVPVHIWLPEAHVEAPCIIVNTSCFGACQTGSLGIRKQDNPPMLSSPVLLVYRTDLLAEIQISFSSALIFQRNWPLFLLRTLLSHLTT